MRRTAVWITLGVLTGAVLLLATVAGETALRAPAQSLLPANDKPNCTALVLDRASGRTVAASCGEGDALPLEAAVRDGPGSHVRRLASRVRA
jgi:hypothetical protein